MLEWGYMKIIRLLAGIGLMFPLIASAHAPVIEGAGSPSAEVPEAEVLSDPTAQSLAVYGTLDAPGEIDIYTFTVKEDAVIPFEALVPKKDRLSDFRPYLSVYASHYPATDSYLPPWQAPEGYVAETLVPPTGERGVFSEEYSREDYFKQTETSLEVRAGERYYLAVFEPEGWTGEYVLGLGSVENFENADFKALLTDVAKVKLNLVGDRSVPWMEFLGLFLFMAGFIVGLGAVTVIDLHGFKGRTSGYWTEATIRTHKITKPLIWFGTALAAIGGYLTYRPSGLSGTALFHAVLLVILVLNGLFLTFAVSPMLLKREKEEKADMPLEKKWQRAIAASFVVSFLGWWTSAFLFVWYLVMIR